jgi:hypothetical protein
MYYAGTTLHILVAPSSPVAASTFSKPARGHHTTELTSCTPYAAVSCAISRCETPESRSYNKILKSVGIK